MNLLAIWFGLGLVYGWALKGVAWRTQDFHMEPPVDGDALLKKLCPVTITMNGEQVDMLQIEGALSPAAAAALSEAWYRCHEGPAPKGMV